MNVNTGGREYQPLNDGSQHSASPPCLFVTTVTSWRPPSRGALCNLLRIGDLSGTSRFRWNCLIRRLWSALGDLHEQDRWPELGNALLSVQSLRLWGLLRNFPVGRFASQSVKNVTTCNHRKEPVGARAANWHCSHETRQDGSASSYRLLLPLPLPLRRTDESYVRHYAS
jgi:hypothetical protein